MDRTESLSHSKWECKYHVVFIPKRRRKTLFGAVESRWARCSTASPGRRQVGLKKGT